MTFKYNFLLFRIPASKWWVPNKKMELTLIWPWGYHQAKSKFTKKYPRKGPEHCGIFFLRLEFSVITVPLEHRAFDLEVTLRYHCLQSYLKKKFPALSRVKITGFFRKRKLTLIWPWRLSSSSNPRSAGKEVLGNFMLWWHLWDISVWPWVDLQRVFA